MKRGFVLPDAAAEAAFFGALLFPQGKGLNNSLALEVAREQKLEGMLPHLVEAPSLAFRNRAQAAMKMDVVSELGALLFDVPHVFFKGALSDPLFFGGIGKRGACDIDLCVLPQHRQEVRQRLETIGYKAKPRTRFTEHSKERSFVAEKSRPTLDVHTAFLNPWAFRDQSASVLERSEIYQSPWGPIRGPSPEDMLLIFAGNLATDRCTGRVKFALDASALLNRFSIDWTLVTKRAQKWRCDTGLYALCRLLEVRFKRTIPEVVKGLRPGRLREAWLNQVLGLSQSSKRRSIRGRFQTMALCDWALSENAFFPLQLANRYRRAYKEGMPGRTRA